MDCREQAKEKLSKLQDTLMSIEKTHGKGTVMIMGESPEPVPMISTGNIGLDYVFGGGVAKGRIIEVLGMESGGKTSMCLQTIAEVQKTGGLAAILDAEHALDPSYAENLGVRVDELLIHQPDFGEQALEVACALIESGQIDLIVIDSVAALTPKSEIEGEMGDAQMGKQARLMSQAMRKLTAIMGKNRTTVIFTNQWRSKIGGYGNPEVATGGNALKFAASQRVDLRKREITKVGDEATGTIVKVKNLKNKVAVPFKSIELSTKFGEGFNKYLPLLDLGVTYKVIEKSGTWYSINGEKIGQGKENAMNYLRANEDICNKLDDTLRRILFPRMYSSQSSVEASKPARKVSKEKVQTIEVQEEVDSVEE